jgi:hypothetical protein
MKPINYDAPASLWKEMLGEVAPGKLAHTHTQQIETGTLRSCIAAFDAKPDSKKVLYSIITDDSAHLAKTTLFRQDIEALRSAA